MKEQLYTEPGVIRTHSGQYINVFQPEPSHIHLADIAHGLSHTCRWGGHTPYFYSVAQHSLAVSFHLEEQQAPHRLILEGLLHDAAEAYLLDLPSPIKCLLPDYSRLEHNLLKAIFSRFGLTFSGKLHPLVIAADKYWLEKEWNELILHHSQSELFVGGRDVWGWSQDFIQKVNHYHHLLHYNHSSSKVQSDRT